MATNANNRATRNRRPGTIGAVKRSRYGLKAPKADVVVETDPAQLYVINDTLVKGVEVELVPVKARTSIVFTPDSITVNRTAISDADGRTHVRYDVEGVTDRGQFIRFAAAAKPGSEYDLKLISKPYFI